MRYLLLLCVFLFSMQSCTLPAPSGQAFILNEKNLDRTVWGFYDPNAQRTFLLAFYIERGHLLGVYCEALTESQEEAMREMEEGAKTNPQNYVFRAELQKDYVVIFGPRGLVWNLRPLNQQEALYTTIIYGVSTTYSAKRFR